MASKEVGLHEEAFAEAQAAYDWYATRNPAAAQGFIDELDHVAAVPFFASSAPASGRLLDGCEDSSRFGGGTNATPLFHPLLLLGAITGSFSTLGPRRVQAQSPQNHLDWVTDALKRMQTIKPGMTRSDLLKLFTTEGGLYTGLQRTFVSRDCLYFKVDVEFKAVGRPSRDRDGRGTLIEDGRDIIVKISRPYLAFAVVD